MRISNIPAASHRSAGQQLSRPRDSPRLLPQTLVRNHDVLPSRAPGKPSPAAQVGCRLHREEEEEARKG